MNLAAKPAIINKQMMEDEREDLVDEKQIKPEPVPHPDELKLAIDNEPESDGNNHESSSSLASAPPSTVMCHLLFPDAVASAVATKTKRTNGHSFGANNNADTVNKRHRGDVGCRIVTDEIEVLKESSSHLTICQGQVERSVS